jgi:hypothetical protein
MIDVRWKERHACGGKRDTGRRHTSTRVPSSGAGGKIEVLELEQDAGVP